MKRHFIKNYIFTMLFLFVIFGYSAYNLYVEFPKLMEWVNQQNDLKDMEKKVAELDTIINENIAEKHSLIELYGFAQVVLRKNEENSFSVVKDCKGELNYAESEQNLFIMEDNFKYLVKIKSLAEENGAKMIIFMAPDKYIRGESVYETGIPYSDENWVLDRLKARMEKENIYCIDSRDYIKDIEIMSGESVFFYTDHHWRIKSAYMMFAIMTAKIKEDFGDDLDPEGKYTNLYNYNVYHYNKSFLGSMGRETGITYAGLDDFDLIFPKFNTLYNRKTKSTVLSEYREISGTFLDCILSPYNIFNTTNIYNSDLYSTYLDAVTAEEYINNLMNPEGPRVLVLRDSYMGPLGAFLSTECSQLDMLWNIRYDGDLEKVIREGNYDYVIFQTGSDNLSNMDMLKCVKDTNKDEKNDDK